RLVGTQQLDHHPVGLLADPRLQRSEHRGQCGIVRGGHPQVEGGTELHVGVEVQHHLGNRQGSHPSGGELGRATPQLGDLLLGQLLHAREHERLPGREIVLRGTARDPAPLGALEHRRGVPTALGQAVHGGTDQPAPGRPASFLPRARPPAQYGFGRPRLCSATTFSPISLLTGAIRPTRTAPSRVPSPYSEASPLPPWVCTAWSTVRVAASAAAYLAMLAASPAPKSSPASYSAAAFWPISLASSVSILTSASGWAMP